MVVVDMNKTGTQGAAGGKFYFPLRPRPDTANFRERAGERPGAPLAWGCVQGHSNKVAAARGATLVEETEELIQLCVRALAAQMIAAPGVELHMTPNCILGLTDEPL